jgi:hypothetical protein
MQIKIFTTKGASKRAFRALKSFPRARFFLSGNFMSFPDAESHFAVLHSCL